MSKEMLRILTVPLAAIILISSATLWQVHDIESIDMKPTITAKASWQTGPNPGDVSEYTLEKDPEWSRELFLQKFEQGVEAMKEVPGNEPWSQE